MKTDIENIEVFMQGDLVRRAILNILTNAVEHSNQQEQAITLTVRREHHERLLFAIQDEGVGFSKNVLEHGTELFYMQNEARSTGHYGIGLNFARQTAALHGGEVVLSNNETGGSVHFMIAI